MFGLLVGGSKADGFAAAYPTAAERAHLAASFSANIGLRVLLGMPHDITAVTGFTTWNTSGAIMIFGCIWGLLTATKYFRGEEESGRMELMLAGPNDISTSDLQYFTGPR